MTYPTKPDPAYDYSSFQASNPATPLPGDRVDIDYANHKAAIDAVIDFIKSCFRSDGVLNVANSPAAADLTAYTAQSAASATAAASSATAAAASAAAAAASASSAVLLTGTSTTSLAIGSGTKSFVTQTGRGFVVGQYLIAASLAGPSNYMFGQVLAYNAGTGALDVDVQVVGGSGTKADWSIAVAGARGATGAPGAPGATGSPGSGGTEATGTVRFFHGRIADIPAGNLPMNGAAVSRSTYSDLFALLVHSATNTITVASPAVVGWTGHGLDDGDPYVPTTTGALPTGLTAGMTYYVKAVDANSFQLAATPGGAAINTTGTQSGTHTGTSALCGLGDGSTTFNTPDWRGVSPIGHDMMGSTAKGALTFAGSGIYGRSNGQVAGAENDNVVNVQHTHSYGSARLTSGGSLYAAINQPVNPDSGFPDPNFTTFTGGAIDNGGAGVTGAQGTASVKYKRVGRVATGIWIIKT